MHAILGAKFIDVFNGADIEVARDEWGRALADLKPVELSRGLDELSKRRFPPTLGEFMCMCRPCLDHEWAFHHARDCLMQRDRGSIGDWSHPAVWRAASTMALEVRAGDYAKVRSRWKFELDKELSHGWGQMPDPPPLALSDNSKTSGNSSVALRERRRIAELMGKLPKEVGDGPAE